MAEYIEMMGLKWWLICWSCKQKVHIRAVLNREGICPKDDCGAVIVERIEENKPITKKAAAVQSVSPAPAATPTIEKTENKVETEAKVLEN